MPLPALRMEVLASFIGSFTTIVLRFFTTGIFDLCVYVIMAEDLAYLKADV